MREKTITGYPSVDKPWLKYYSEEEVNIKLPERTMYEHILVKMPITLIELPSIITAGISATRYSLSVLIPLQVHLSALALEKAT